MQAKPYHLTDTNGTVSQRDEYETELTGSRAEIASVLHGVADGLRTGAVRLGDETGAVTVETPEELTLEIEFETEDDGASLELELEWSVSSDTAAVSSAEPASEETAEEPTPVGAADGSQSLARFEVYQARDDTWRWRLRHHNGNIIATGGQGYTRKHNALKGLRSVMANSPEAAVNGEFTE